MPNRSTLRSFPSADTAQRTRQVFVSDLILNCLIGVHRHEQDGKQRVRVNLDLTVEDQADGVDDKLANVVSYEDIVLDLRALADAGHISLVETLAERIAELCLVDPRVQRARVRVEKLDVFADAESVGVEIERKNPKT
ncbi:MAG: dihydroneopterin aldolase [Rhodospirillales bacterium]|nr:dihydroneopterin aldolase [Rhodospirillales bacterium]